MDANSAAIIVIGLIIIMIGLLNHLGKNTLNTSVTTWSDRQLLNRSKTFDRMVQASLDANDAQRAQQYRERLDAVRTEIARRKFGKKAR